jgi:NAD(P)-dependent dehydrogenase (short-subunit alcohol dehydrogenase family)
VIVDFLVNNAGFASLGPVAALDPDEVGTTVNLNVKAVMENTAFVLSFTQAVCAEKPTPGSGYSRCAPDRSKHRIVARIGSRLPESLVLTMASRIMKRNMAPGAAHPV